ncbi:MAG TPA: hypothetical protein DCW68_02900 [Rhodospirillaceae bacterium]|nr:MAG: hypothetical protein A2018_05875 [Alphaproteobacteria bacterium GWF2_58_20]HAU29040.1 hypothetical protein [Rhodospirillaceae bacterium]
MKTPPLQIPPGIRIIGPPKNECGRAWAAHIPVPPQELQDLLCSPPLDGAILAVHIPSAERLAFVVEKCGAADKKDKMYSFTFTLQPAEQEGELMIASVAPHLQGQGIAKQAVSRLFDMARRHFNVRRIHTSASHENGGYTWARFGFYPKQADWDTLRTGALAQKADSFAHGIPEPAMAQLQAALACPLPEALGFIAALKTPTRDIPLGQWLMATTRCHEGKGRLSEYGWEQLSACARARLEKLEGQVPAPTLERLADLLESPLDQSDRIAREITAPVSGIPLGQLMLSGCSWRGTLNLDNSAQAAIYTAYVGQGPVRPDIPAPLPPALRRPKGPS